MSWNGKDQVFIGLQLREKQHYRQFGSDYATIDCTTNGIEDATLDTDGNVTNEIIIQTGCGGSSSSLSDVSSKITVISGGFQEYDVSKDSDGNQYRFTFAFQKQ